MLNKCIYLISIAVFAMMVSCSSTSLSTKKEVKTYYPSGKLKSITNYQAEKKNGEEFVFNEKGDTIKVSFYIEDSIAYHLEFDTVGKKIYDYRRVFYQLEKKRYQVNDSIMIKYHIIGPDAENLLLSAAVLRVKPDTNGGFVRKIVGNETPSSQKYLFVPNAAGKYSVQIGVIEKKLFKVIGSKEFYITVD